jgi:Zn-dependent peptidase ImmA (M78 family)
MSGQTWAHLAGDTSRFAIQFGLESNPHDPDFAAAEVAASWGSFQVWVDGLNLCAHREQGETMESVHWYILPLIEWLIENWDPILHEERLPAPDFATAAEVAHDQSVIMAQFSGRPDADWSPWWARHNLQAGREGGLFPDVFIRRYRAVVEFSWDSRHLPSAPDDFTFQASDGTYRVDVEAVARPLYDALGQALGQLATRLPHSSHIAELQRRHHALATGATEGVHRRRFAWLSGFGGASDRFARVWDVVSEQLVGRFERLRGLLLATDARQPLFIPGTPHAAVLYGSVSPNITDHDMLQISRILIDAYTPQADQRREPLEDLRARLPQLPDADRPWEQGYALASSVLDALGLDTSRAIDIRRVAAARLGVTIDTISLTDSQIRALSISSPEHAPTIFLNDGYIDGTSEPVQRFSIAHELCHLLVDPDQARNLAVTSGPWAPRDVEQRANAFAAAVLLPEADVVRLVSSMDDPADISSVDAVARRYQVSAAAVLEHLHNLGLLDRDDRDRLRTIVVKRYS